MATYSISAKPSGSSKDNNASRNIASIFSYDSNTHKTISYLKRKNGVWCSCGGTSQNVVLRGYDQLINTSTGTVIKTSSTEECKVRGTGPSSDNYMTTIFSSWTEAESNAAVAAWAAGTLQIKRTVSVKSYSSSNHGSPTFRDGYYDDVITIEGSTVPFTNYEPTIVSLAIMRSDDGVTEEQLSTSLYASIKIDMLDKNGLNDNPKLYLQHSTDSYFQENVTTVTLGTTKSAIEPYFNQQSIKLAGTFDISKNYYFRLIFSAGEEIAEPWLTTVGMAYVPFHIPENNSGIAFGMYSTSNTYDQRLESDYAAYFYKGIAEIGPGWTELTPMTGSTPAVYGGGTLRCRSIENKRIIDGSILVKPGSDTIVLAQLPEGYTPYNAIFSINACEGSRVARIVVGGNGEENAGKLALSWVRNLSDGEKYTAEAIWVQCSIEYWVGFTGEIDGDTSVLGTAILGQMILGGD